MCCYCVQRWQLSVHAFAVLHDVSALRYCAPKRSGLNAPSVHVGTNASHCLLHFCELVLARLLCQHVVGRWEPWHNRPGGEASGAGSQQRCRVQTVCHVCVSKAEGIMGVSYATNSSAIISRRTWAMHAYTHNAALVSELLSAQRTGPEATWQSLQGMPRWALRRRPSK